MTAIRALLLAFSMFSRVPVPQGSFDAKTQKYALLFLPLVGTGVGLALWGYLALAKLLAFGTILTAAGLTLLPVLVTGGIHLDGFCDTVDALASHASPERRREILKDPHAGAFAVIFACAYFLGYFALCAEGAFGQPAALLFALLHMLSRALGGALALGVPAASEQGLLALFQRSADRKACLAGLIAVSALCAGALILIDSVRGIAMAAGALFVLLYVRRRAKFDFGGMSGDLVGFYIQLAELVMLLCAVFAGKAAIWF